MQRCVEELGAAGCVYTHENQLQTPHLHPVSVVVQQQPSRARHLLGLHHCLEVSQQGHMLGHVCRQDLTAEGQAHGSL